MSDEWRKYVDDPRTICKYGSKCYQKNPQHNTTYKHPPSNSTKDRRKKTQNRFSPYSKDKKQTNQANNGTPACKEQENVKTTKGSEEESNTAVTHKVQNKNTDGESKLNLKQDEVEIFENESRSPSSKDLALEKDDQRSIILQDNLIMYDPHTSHDILKELFLVEMPSDFFKFYDCLNVNNAFEKTLASVNLEPIGPYDLLLGKLPKLTDKKLYLSHWRFFYDPPEFQAVLKKKGQSEHHIGYYRDDPNEKPVFLASNDSAKDCHITPMAENIFGAVYLLLQNEKKTPFNQLVCQKLMDKIKVYADANNYSLDEFSMRKRLPHTVAKGFHGAGIVVPYNKKTQLGYRHLAETDVNIKKLFAKLKAAKSDEEKDGVLSEIQPIITYASIAVDECDFGTGIEAGIALFCSGLKELESPALSSLTAAYSLLNREAFSKIIQAHLTLRRRGPNMSILSLSKRAEK